MVNAVLPKASGPYGVIFITMCVVKIVAMVKLSRGFWFYGIIFIIMCVSYFRFCSFLLANLLVYLYSKLTGDHF
jgi:hypothetical protein